MRSINDDGVLWFWLKCRPNGSKINHHSNEGLQDSLYYFIVFNINENKLNIWSSSLPVSSGNDDLEHSQSINYEQNYVNGSLEINFTMPDQITQAKITNFNYTSFTMLASNLTFNFVIYVA